jgi:hypothetical protein
MLAATMPAATASAPACLKNSRLEIESMEAPRYRKRLQASGFRPAGTGRDWKRCTVFGRILS